MEKCCKVQNLHFYPAVLHSFHPLVSSFSFETAPTLFTHAHQQSLIFLMYFSEVLITDLTRFHTKKGPKHQ